MKTIIREITEKYDIKDPAILDSSYYPEEQRRNLFRLYDRFKRYGNEEYAREFIEQKAKYITGK